MSVSNLKLILVEFDVKEDEMIFVVVRVFAIYKLVACVVSGKIPNTTFEAFRLLRVFPEPMNHPAVTSPVAFRFVRVPTDVILV